jgi:hypothetical protein
MFFYGFKRIMGAARIEAAAISKKWTKDELVPFDE